ncbi:head fiber protein [Brevibacillus centrosporus]|uniref:head fiber protein n=1 Tax=Brevibacillus centrosporus TaxID=54910 RepID=UPI0039866950
MGHQTKNYITDNGDRNVIGGILEIVGEGQILKNGVPIEFGGGPTDIADGTVTLAKLGADTSKALNGKLTAKKAAAQADSTATDIEGLVTDFNHLLAKLRAAGIMA